MQKPEPNFKQVGGLITRNLFVFCLLQVTVFFKSMLILIIFYNGVFLHHCTKKSFSLRIFSVNMTADLVTFTFDHVFCEVHVIFVCITVSWTNETSTVLSSSLYYYSQQDLIAKFLGESNSWKRLYFFRCGTDSTKSFEKLKKLMIMLYVWRGWIEFS